jgi:ParB family chromosome partitioning protein
MPRRTGLGRGLEALIPGGEQPFSGGVSSIPADQIVPNPRQPRNRFDPQELAELSDSIREHGVIQPLIVSYDEQSGMYVLIAGERRLMASRQAGLEHVPAIVREASDQQRLELALIENVQRADLGPLERARPTANCRRIFNTERNCCCVGKAAKRCQYPASAKIDAGSDKPCGK